MLPGKIGSELLAGAESAVSAVEGASLIAVEGAEGIKIQLPGLIVLASADSLIGRTVLEKGA